MQITGLYGNHVVTVSIIRLEQGCPLQDSNNLETTLFYLYGQDHSRKTVTTVDYIDSKSLYQYIIYKKNLKVRKTLQEQGSQM